MRTSKSFPNTRLLISSNATRAASSGIECQGFGGRVSYMRRLLNTQLLMPLDAIRAVCSAGVGRLGYWGSGGGGWSDTSKHSHPVAHVTRCHLHLPSFSSGNLSSWSLRGSGVEGSEVDHMSKPLRRPLVLVTGRHEGMCRCGHSEMHAGLQNGRRIFERNV